MTASTSQNLCLICCYSFQEKRSRFISDEAKESFEKFVKELGGLPLDVSSSKFKLKSSLNLPFGEYITVCGDCLSLIVVYVQRRTVQREKEEELIELQRSVRKAIKELSSVVEDVQCHLNRLHSTVRMGEESILEEFIEKKREELWEVKTFREKILSLSTGVGVTEQNKGIQAPAKDPPIFIKAEPLDGTVDMDISDNENAAISLGEDDDYLEKPVQEPGKIRKDKSGASCDNSNKRRRNLRRRTTTLKKNYRESWPEDDNHQEFSDPEFEAYSHDELDKRLSEDNIDEVLEKELIERPKRRYRRRKLRSKKLTGAVKGGVKRALKFGNMLSPEKAAKWKQDLFERVLEHLNTQKSLIPTKTEQAEGSHDNQNQPPPNSNYFSVVNGNLQLRGVTVKVHEKRRMLECMRCYKMYFEERDVSSPDDNPLESLMRTHVLDKHYLPKKKKPLEEMEIIEYTSHTKSKITYKIADKHKYSYTRRCGKQGEGPCYYRCDFRKGNCSAGLVQKNGKYIRLRKGWNEQGLHAVHPPDVERTNRQIALGKAKLMYLTDDSKTIDEVCSIVLNNGGNGDGGDDQQAPPPPPVPLSKLKRAMVYSKYGSRGMAPEEKMNQILQCCYCGKIYKEGRGLSRHMRAQHQDLKSEEEAKNSSQSSESTTVKSTAAAPQKDLRQMRRKAMLKMGGASKIQTPQEKQKTSNKEEEEPMSSTTSAPELASSSPSIVFNDPSAANNFVNRCITAIMQQVGVSASAVNQAPPPITNRSPIKPLGLSSSKGPPPNSESPAPSESSLHSQEESQSQQHNIYHLHRSGPQSSSQWHQHLQQTQQSPLASGHQPSQTSTSTQYSSPSSSTNNSTVWQWGLH